MAGRARRPVQTESLTGYFLPIRQEEDEDVVTDDDDDDMQWLDANEIEDGSSEIKSSSLKEQVVSFKALNKQSREFEIKGKFLMTDPWWCATLKIRKTKVLRKYIVGYPAYALRTDRGLAEQRVMVLFLKECKVSDQHRDMFISKVEQWQGLDNLNFENLPEYLQRFKDSLDEEEQPIADTMKDLVQSSEAGRLVQMYSELKDFYTYMPQILPKNFSSLLEKYHNDVDMLKKLEEALNTEPWVFGFSSILSFKYRLYGCEAPLKNLKDSGLFDKMPEHIKDALHIYDMLKMECRRNGHTYLFEKYLANRNYDDRKIKHWKEAVEFLESNYVIVREKKRVYRRRLWLYEKQIAEGINDMVRTQTPWKFEIDFSSPEFEMIASDDDQARAAHLISQQAVTALSGKGGCGKTTVVSTVFKHAETLLREEQRNEMRNLTRQFMQHQDLDDSVLNQSMDEMEGMGHMSSQNGENNEEEQDTGQDDTDHSSKSPLILLTAPTGKAANLLGRRSHLPAFTLHQIIYKYRAYARKKRESGGRPEPWEFAQVQALVVDECSLVSVQTFSTMFDILLKNANLQKLVLLGDVNQLPSIEPGNFLADIFKGLKPLGCSLLLTTNHRSEAQLIVDNATTISHMKVPKFDSSQNFHSVLVPELDEGVEPNSNLDDTDSKISVAIKKLLRQDRPCIGSDEKSQFVAFRRRHCDMINNECCQYYSGHPIVNHKGRRDFRVGDKVCCTKNGDVVNHFAAEEQRKKAKAKRDKESGDRTLETTMVGAEEAANLCLGEGQGQTVTNENNGAVNAEGDSNKEPNAKKVQKTRRLCNGEIFFIRKYIEEVKSDGKKQVFLVLDDLESDMIKVDFRQLMRTCKLRHAWARTIHTYQGSEAETVIYVVGSAYYQDWKHVYTAVTRGRRQVFIVTQYSELFKSVGTKPRPRNTSLLENLDSLLPQSFPQPTLVLSSKPGPSLVPGNKKPQIPSSGNSAFKEPQVQLKQNPKYDTTEDEDFDYSQNYFNEPDFEDSHMYTVVYDRKLYEDKVSRPLNGAEISGTTPSNMIHISPISKPGSSVRRSLASRLQDIPTPGSGMSTRSRSSVANESQFSDWGDSFCDEVIKQQLISDSTPGRENKSTGDHPQPNNKNGAAQNTENSESTPEILFDSEETPDELNQTPEITSFSSDNSDTEMNDSSQSLLPQNLPAQGGIALDDGDEDESESQSLLVPYPQPKHITAHLDTNESSNDSSESLSLLTKPNTNNATNVTNSTTVSSHVTAFTNLHTPPSKQTRVNHLTSPKRMSSSSSFGSPKVKRLAAYNGHCTECRSPIRKGMDEITIRETPKRAWIHATCSPRK